MKTDRPDRIALLIDTDNATAGKIDVILAELAKAGVTNIRRAYGNRKKDGLKGWEAAPYEHAIRPTPRAGTLAPPDTRLKRPRPK